MLDVSVWGAFLAGLLSFVSPCVLPLVPPYLAWLAGVSFEELKDDSAGVAQKRRIVLAAVAFVLGFTTVFVGLGATASVVGKTIAQYFDTLSIIAGIIIIIMGLHFLGVFRIGLLYPNTPALGGFKVWVPIIRTALKLTGNTGMIPALERDPIAFMRASPSKPGRILSRIVFPRGEIR